MSESMIATIAVGKSWSMPECGGLMGAINILIASKFPNQIDTPGVAATTTIARKVRTLLL